MSDNMQNGAEHITPGARYLELDALRGFAVMGILVMNILGFALPGSATFNPMVSGGDGSADILSWFFSFIFVDGKMRGLFSLLFGASMFLVITLAEAKGQSPAKTHFSRMFWLGIFGLLHFYFLWWGDILFLYAAIGCIAYLFRGAPAASLIKWALGIYSFAVIIWCLLMGSLFLLKIMADAPDADAQVLASYQEMLDGFGFTAAAAAKDVAVYSGSYADIANHKLRTMAFQPIAMVFQVGFETLPLMMLGMAMMKNGFLLGKMPREVYRKWALWTILPGTIVTAAIALSAYYSGFDAIILVNANLAWALVPRLMMTIGYTALLLMLIQSYSHSALVRRVAATGRAAFTNYLGTSVIMCAIFYGWGLGLYAEFDRVQLWLFVIGMWALMLFWSQPWLMRNRYGPLEWLWRSLSRGKAQPMTLR
jgi:uncharacterized protein